MSDLRESGRADELVNTLRKELYISLANAIHLPRFMSCVVLEPQSEGDRGILWAQELSSRFVQPEFDSILDIRAFL